MTSMPLAADELDRLQNILVERMPAAGCMPLDVAHGFLTATATATATVDNADELLDRVLGALSDDESLHALLSRFRAQIIDDLQRADYGPLVLQLPRDDGSLLPLPYGWCQGYVAGLDYLGEARRDTLLGDERAGGLMTPILSFLMYDEDQYYDPPNEAAHRATVGELGPNAVALFAWWQSHAMN